MSQPIYEEAALSPIHIVVKETNEEQKIDSVQIDNPRPKSILKMSHAFPPEVEV
jgi:hypothetical protein